MTDGIKLILTEDNTLKTYNDEYDITIHCESQAEQDEVLAKLNATPAPEPTTPHLTVDEYIRTRNKNDD